MGLLQKGDQEPASRRRTGESQQATVGERNRRNEVVVLMAGAFAVQEPGRREPVEMIDRLTPAGTRGPLRLPTPETRSLSNGLVDSSARLEGERVVLHRLSVARPERGRKQQQHGKKADEEDRKLHGREGRRVEG